MCGAGAAPPAGGAPTDNLALPDDEGPTAGTTPGGNAADNFDPNAAPSPTGGNPGEPPKT